MVATESVTCVALYAPRQGSLQIGWQYGSVPRGSYDVSPAPQGLPYHGLLVAPGLLVENSLPGTAVVYGEFSPRDGEQARRGLASILGEEFELPVVMDVERMRRRLVGTMAGGSSHPVGAESCLTGSPALHRIDGVIRCQDCVCEERVIDECSRIAIAPFRVLGCRRCVFHYGHLEPLLQQLS